MAVRADLPLRAWQLLLAAAAAGLGVLAGVDPRLALAAAIGLAFVVLVLGDLVAGLCLFAFVSFLDLAPALGGSLLSFTKVVGLLLAISWLATVTTRDDAENDFLTAHPQFAYVLALFVAFATLSLSWAEAPDAGFGAILRYALNVILFLIVYTALRRPRHVVLALGAFVAGATVAAAYALVSPPSDVPYYDLQRATGTVGDPNELAAVLVAGTVLAAALAAVLREWPLGRLAAAGAAVLCAAGIFLSLSRGGLVALAFALLVSIVVGGRWRPHALALTLVIAICGVGYYQLYASEGAVYRVTHLSGGTGREDIWRVGWRMVEDQPLRGVGVGNFQTASIHYLIEPGAVERDEFIVDQPKVAHNTYLHVLAELGVVGAILFLSILALSIGCALRAARTFMRLGDARMELLARALVVAIAGILAADFFISEQYGKQLWLLLGFGPAMLGIARKAERASPTA